MADYEADDCRAILNEFKEEDSRLRLKRRWLMNLPMSERDHKRIKKLDPLSDKSIPEAMLREDDVYYDNIKNFVVRVSGASTSGKGHTLCLEKLFQNGSRVKKLISVLNGMTDKGLCSLSELVTEGLIEFEKTKPKMKKIIKKHLRTYLDCENSDLQERKDRISSLLNNPQYFSGKEHTLCLEKLFENGSRVKNLTSVLDGMTNKGLCSLSELVTEGLIEFEKTKQKMKKIIKKHLRTYLDSENSDLQERKDRISSLLNNPQYFSGNREDFCSPSECFRGSAITVLDMLEELPPHTLEAMVRRLEGITGSSIPKLLDHREARTKGYLVKSVRIHCMKLLRKLDEGEHPPESLVEALSIASVTLKRLLGHTHVAEFKRFSPEVEDLQNSIVKAIHLINAEKKVDFNVIEVACKKLRNLSEHEAEVPKIRLRSAVRNRLIEYLVECGYMESIPKPFLEILNYIITTSHSSSSGSISKNEVEEEVEFLLCFSAKIKQIIWDILPDDEEVDQDFATAYMEEPEDSDDEDYKNEFLASRDLELDPDDSYSETESIGETKPYLSPVSTQKAYDSPLNVKQEPVDINQESGSVWSSVSYRNRSSSRNRPLASFEDVDNEAKPDDSELKTNRKDTPVVEGHMQGQFGNTQQQQQQQQQQRARKNKYLSIQRACDETAMAMHRAIDGILKEFAES